MLLFCFIATVRLEYENFGIKFYSPVGIFSRRIVYGCGTVNDEIVVRDAHTHTHIIVE